MCGHCEAWVKRPWGSSRVESAAVSHEAGTAVVTLKRRTWRMTFLKKQ